MLCITDTTTDAYWNLAAEEYLLKEYDRPVFRLWRNEPSIIIGRYQNALAEINTEYVRQNGIPVVRRLTGGGAVFHDLGNLNYTFIDTKRPDEDTSAMFRRFTAPIIAALRTLGIDAALEGRNDLVIREHISSSNSQTSINPATYGNSKKEEIIRSRKFSGNAICVHGDRVLQHGTLLFSASMNSLSEALNTRPEKFIGKSVQSNRSRVTNISEHLPADRQMDIEGFIAYLREFITGWKENQPAQNSHKGNVDATSDNTYQPCITSNSVASNFTLHTYSDADLQAIKHLRDTRYATEEWNFGQSPRYSYSNTFRLPCGLFEVYLEVRSGIITDCRIMGDYFFLRPTEDICAALTGTPHTHDAIHATLSRFPLADYFGADIAAELTEHLL